MVGGFRKSDVLEFVDQLDAHYKQQEQQLNQTIEKTREDFKKSEEENGRLREQVKDFEAELEIQKENIRVLQDQKRETDAEISRLTEESDRKDREIDSQRSGNLLLQHRLASSNQESGEKDQKISELEGKVEALQATIENKNKTEDQIGRVMLEARSAADRMIDEANAKSRQIVQQAYDKIGGLTGDVREFKQKVTGIHESTKEFFQTVDSMLNAIEESADLLDCEYIELVNSAVDGERGAEPSKTVFLEENGVQGDVSFCGSPVEGNDCESGREDCGFAEDAGGTN